MSRVITSRNVTRAKLDMAKKQAAKVQEGKTVELPTAKELMTYLTQKEAEKASEYMRQQSAAERKKRALMEPVLGSACTSEGTGCDVRSWIFPKACLATWP
jgi:hypothetical protein